MPLIDILLLAFIRFCLWLRYRIEVRGLEGIAQRYRRGVLFLPNHPALIDPVILMARLFGRFRTRALADQDQIDRFFVRFMAKRARILPLPSLTKSGTDSAQRVRQTIDQCVEALRQGDNLVLYPAGQLMTANQTVIAGNSAVETILKQLPETPVVLVRTTGLWGSRFGWARGREPQVAGALKHGIKGLLLSGLFFAPRRRVTVEFEAAEGLPRQGTRKEINGWLEAWYNRQPATNTYVPYSCWESGGTRTLAEPGRADAALNDHPVPDSVRQQVTRYLSTQTGMETLQPGDRLSVDLGMDSLAIAELIGWLEGEFGVWQLSVESLQTVGDVLLAACGEAVGRGAQTATVAVDPRWFAAVPGFLPAEQLALLPGKTIGQAFLDRARTQRNRAIVADSISGVKTYGDLLTAVFVLKKQFERLPGERLGILMPASVASATFYLAALFSGKTPVMINWTLGERNLLHSIECAGVQRIVTSRALLERLGKQGFDSKALADRLVCIETIREQITGWDKIKGALAARFNLGALDRANMPAEAVVLFTSGSESVPKAVPLTHRNILTNIRDGLQYIDLKGGDILLGILPPFHSFGITACTVLPLVTGIRTVYYPNPTHGAALAGVIEAFKATLLVGTPTFLNGIIRGALPGQIDSLRLVVSGAEKCPQRVYDAVHQRCRQMTVLEGYGVTECSPILSANTSANPIPGAIGKILPSLEYAIVHPERLEPVAPGQPGLLLVRGDSVFSGYLNYDGPSPFMPYAGKEWYRTGDLVSESADGVLTFCGRLKRFVKMGGEMISLPAIEAALQAGLDDRTGGEEDGPTFCVGARTVDDRPEIILFTTRPIGREAANAAIRAAGLSGLHNIRQVVKLEAIPLLGTGKIDYKKLEQIDF